MNVRELSRLAWKHARNTAAEELYLRGLGDATRPVSVHALVNERCNYRCRYCEFWRMEHYRDEMSIEEWKRALASLKEFLGHFHVEFSGGEPFIKKGFVDLLPWCRDQDIGWGVTTNGSALSPKTIATVVAAHPFNVNVSIDSHEQAVHDYTRGREGSHEKLARNLRVLIEQRDAAGQSFPIIIKPVVNVLNFRQLPLIVEWVQQLGPAVVNFQPMDRWTRESYEELWIEEEDHPELERVVDELLELKAKGAPIMNSELVLGAFVKHFREESAPVETMPCRVGMRNFFIRPDGNVEVCWSYPPIGNIRAQSAREIWRGHEARQRRKETTACERLCLFTCLSQKTLGDKVKMGITLLGQIDAHFKGARTVKLPSTSAKGRTPPTPAAR